MQLDDLPALRVEAISPDSDDPRLIGRFTHLRGVAEGRSWLYAGDQSLIGHLVDLDDTSLAAVFIAPFWSPDSPVQVGSVVPWVDGRWQAYHVKMIIDPTADWRRVEFIPSDAQHFVERGVRGWRKVGRPLPEGAIPIGVEIEGWDHEECELCDRHIARWGSPWGYVDQKHRWLCEDCYEKYAARRSLGFLQAI